MLMQRFPLRALEVKEINGIPTVIHSKVENLEDTVSTINTARIAGRKAELAVLEPKTD